MSALLEQKAPEGAGSCREVDAHIQRREGLRSRAAAASGYCQTPFADLFLRPRDLHLPSR